MPDDPKKPDLDGRTPEGRFAKGNPGGTGRKRMPEDLREMLAAACPAAAKRLIEALDAERAIVVPGGHGQGFVEHVPDWDLRVKASGVILDRVYGKPAQTITGEDGQPVAVAVDLAALLERLV